jgi:alpha-glucosidase
MTRTGVPLMRPVWLDYPQSTGFYGDNREFLFGRDFFVAPVTTETLDAEDVHLPPGEWYDYWTAQKHTGKDKIALHPALDEVPLYVRAGAIIPMQPVVQNTGEKPDGALELHIYPGQDCVGALYEDDGHTFAYQKGEFLRVNYSCQAAMASITVTSSTEKNAFQPWWNTTEVTIFGAASEPKEVQVRGQVIHNWRYDSRSHAVILTVLDAVKDWNIQLAF